MTPTISSYPIAVTEPLPPDELEPFAEDMRRARIPYVIVKDRYKHPEAKTERTKRELCSLWRAEIPSDRPFADRQIPLFSFWGYIKRGRVDGPKPGTSIWKKRIVETWSPEEK